MTRITSIDVDHLAQLLLAWDNTSLDVSLALSRFLHQPLDGDLAPIAKRIHHSINYQLIILNVLLALQNSETRYPMIDPIKPFADTNDSAPADP